MKYEDIYIGQKESLEHTITQDDIRKFVDLSGDDNRLHVDKEFAAHTSFKRPVVHGMIGASFISTLIGTVLPGDGALWYSQTLEFLLPARIGDHIKVAGEVIGKNDKEHSIDLNIEITNQNRQIITKGKSKVKVVDFEILESKEERTTPKKLALVLGATGGIGSAVCRKLADNGYDIAIHYNRSKDKAEKLKNELNGKCRSMTFPADINDIESIKMLVGSVQQRLGDITFFVNCASFPIPAIKVGELQWADFMAQFNVNVKVNLDVIEALLPTMKKNRYGKIVLIGSLAADKPNSNWVHYITAKSALEGFGKSMAAELAPFGININMVSASLLDTELTSDIPQKTKLLTAAQTPIRRLGTPEDVAGAISFLSGDDAGFLVGEIIRVNGGQYFK